MDYIKIYNNVVKDLEKIKKEKRFDNLFLLTCLLIYNMSCEGDQLGLTLRLINEFDYDIFSKKESD